MEKFLQENPYGKISTEIFLKENLCGKNPTGKISTGKSLRKYSYGKNLYGNISMGKILRENLYENPYGKTLREKFQQENSCRDFPVGIFTVDIE